VAAVSVPRNVHAWGSSLLSRGHLRESFSAFQYVRRCFAACFVPSRTSGLLPLEIKVPGERLRAGPSRRLARRAAIAYLTDTLNPSRHKALVVGNLRLDRPNHAGNGREHVRGRFQSRTKLARDDTINNHLLGQPVQGRGQFECLGDGTAVSRVP